MFGMTVLISEPLPHDLKVAAAAPTIASISRQEKRKANSAVMIFSLRKPKTLHITFSQPMPPLYLIGQDKITHWSVPRCKGTWAGDRAVMIGFVVLSWQVSSWASVSREERGMVLDT